MLRAHSVASIRAAEEIAATRTGWDALMQAAAHGLAMELADIPVGDVVVMLIGPGNNGGDALFAATHLLDRGVRVDLCLLDEDHVHRAGLAAALAAGAEVVDRPTCQRWAVDALFGIGARPGLSGRAADWATWIDQTHPVTVAVDTPSGIDVDSGACGSRHVVADRTVTFGAYKTGLMVAPAAFAAGEIRLVSIGLEPHLGAPDVEVLQDSDGHLLATAVPRPEAHKYSRGVVGVATGSAAYAGAAHLSIAGALAGPAGMVRFVGDDVLAARVVDRAPEVVATQGRVQAWVVGSGGGDRTAGLLRQALADQVPVVVDAQALRHLEETPHAGERLVLTPHAGELAEMSGVGRAEVEAAPLIHARAAARRWRATVLLKGARTVIATPGRPTRVNASGTPWLATAGSGDVLAGFIGSLLATGLTSHDAASLGAFLHGRAAERASSGGPMTASRVAEVLPGAIAAFLEGRRTW